MKFRKFVKYSLVTILLAVVAFIGFIGYSIVFAAYWFGLEDRVVYHYAGLVSAIEKYKEERGEFPETLALLESDPLQDVPEIPQIFKTEYYLIPERNAWKLDVLVRGLGSEKQFIYVSDNKLSEEEKERYSWCHNWYIRRVE